MPSRCSMWDSSMPPGPPPTIATRVRSMQNPPGAARLSLRQVRDEARESRSSSKHLEIFAVLPVRHFGLQTIDLRVLDVDIIVHERRPQRVAEERIVVQRKHRLAQRLRQQRGLGLVGRIGRWTGIELAVGAAEGG